jgi:hypothetical protein
MNSQIDDRRLAQDVVTSPSQDAPEVVPLELLRQVAGGLPFNVGARVPAGDASEQSLPYNVG